jgi:hypothetical protein
MQSEDIGELSLLNVGTGEEKQSAATLIKDMLRRGFAILIEAGQDEKGPLYRRALDFDENTHEYIVAGLPEDLALPESAKEEAVAPRRRGRKPAASKRERVPAKSTKGVAVGRTAGG